MLTSKERAELRSKANTLDTTLMVGKGGVTEMVIAEADNQLTARELVKGKVLEGAFMTPREVSDAICEATGADGVAVIGTKFVIYRFSEKCQEERTQTGRAKRKEVKVNPVRKGAQARRQAARKVREQRNEYFRQQAIEKSIEKAREKKHMLFSEAAQMAKNAKVEKLWLTHFSPSLNEPEECLPVAQAIFAETELGEERKTLTIEFPKEG